MTNSKTLDLCRELGKAIIKLCRLSRPHLSDEQIVRTVVGTGLTIAYVTRPDEAFIDRVVDDARKMARGAHELAQAVDVLQEGGKA